MHSSAFDTGATRRDDSRIDVAFYYSHHSVTADALFHWWRLYLPNLVAILNLKLIKPCNPKAAVSDGCCKTVDYLFFLAFVVFL